MTRNSTIVFLAIILFFAVVFSLPRMFRKAQGMKIPLPKDLAALTAFTDAPSFEVGGNKKHYRYARPELEPYLRFSFPSGPYSEVRLRLSLRAAPRLLEKAFPRGATVTPTLLCPIDIQGDIATFQFAHVSEPATEFRTGRTYIGISFPHGLLTTNDVIELVDFKFSYDLED